MPIFVIMQYLVSLPQEYSKKVSINKEFNTAIKYEKTNISFMGSTNFCLFSKK